MKKIVLGLLTLTSAAAQSLTWDNNTETNLAGYHIFFNDGTNRLYTATVQTNLVPLTNLTIGKTYRIYATAFNRIGLESAPSTNFFYTPLPPILFPVMPGIISERATALSSTQWNYNLAWMALPTNYAISDYMVAISQNGGTTVFHTGNNNFLSVTIPAVSPTLVFLSAVNALGSVSNQVSTLVQPGRAANIHVIP